MKIAIFSTHKFEKNFLNDANKISGHELVYIDAVLNEQTVSLASGCDVVAAFVSDKLDRKNLEKLKSLGIKLIALRSAGFNHVDLKAASELGLPVVRVPEYSPYAVAEHAVCLILALNRKIHKAYNRIKEFNFTLDGLVGFDLHGKTVGVIGTGKIGSAFARIMMGFGCRVLTYDLKVNQSLQGVQNTTLEDIYKNSDIISLHVPLTPKTHHIINKNSLDLMKENVLLINTGRGALIDTQALIQSLKKEKIGAAGLDVYEEEEGIFFNDLSDKVLQDDVLARLLTFPNVLITAHQAFLTVEALSNIAATTLQNISDYEAKKPLLNEVHQDTHVAK